MKKFKIHLNCDKDNVLNILRKNTDSPTISRILRLEKEPMFWGKISDKKAIIWPKGCAKDISATKMKCQVEETDKGVNLLVKIAHHGFVRIPIQLLQLSIIIYFFSAITALCFFFSSNKLFTLFFSATLLSFFIFFVGLMQILSSGQEKQLETFVKNLFKHHEVTTEQEPQGTT